MVASQTATTGWQRHVALLAFGTFAVGTDAFVVSGLLPDISHSLGVGLGAAGQVVTVFSIAYAVCSVALGALASRWSSRTALLLALGLFAVGNAFSALAPTYPTLLISRVIAAAGAALYTATASATAAAMAGPERRGRAIAIVMFGLTASLVLGAPAGTAVGSALGWRATLWGVTGLGLLSALALGLALPDVRRERPERPLADTLAVVADRRVLALLVRTFVVFSGVYLPYTYISAVYRPLAAAGITLSVVLLVYGLAASAGNMLAGRLADRHDPRRVLLVMTALLTAAYALVPLARDVPVAGVVAVVVTAWLSFSLTTPQQYELLALAPDAGARATAWYQGVLYGAVAVSGLLGAVVLDVLGAARLPLVAAALTLAAALLSARWRLPLAARRARTA